MGGGNQVTKADHRKQHVTTQRVGLGQQLWWWVFFDRSVLWSQDMEEITFQETKAHCIAFPKGILVSQYKNPY